MEYLLVLMMSQKVLSLLNCVKFTKWIKGQIEYIDNRVIEKNKIVL